VPSLKLTPPQKPENPNQCPAGKTQSSPAVTPAEDVPGLGAGRLLSVLVGEGGPGRAPPLRASLLPGFVTARSPFPHGWFLPALLINEPKWEAG